MSDGKILTLEDLELNGKVSKYIKISISDATGANVYLGNILKDDLKRISKSLWGVILSWEQFAASKGLVVNHQLIQNTEPVSLEQAKSQSPAYALRWRYRVCQKTGVTFDITQEGLFYRCGAAAEEWLWKQLNE